MITNNVGGENGIKNETRHMGVFFFSIFSRLLVIINNKSAQLSIHVDEISLDSR